MAMREIKGLESKNFLLIFQQICFFEPFSNTEKELMAGSYTHLVGYDSGEYLIEEGSAKEKSLFILLSGGASVVKKGARIPLANMSPGDFFGEVSFLTPRVRTSNVIVHPPFFRSSGDEVPTIPNLLQLVDVVPELHHATATALRFDAELLPCLPPTLRIKFKDQIIQHLTCRVDVMHEKVVRITGQDPLLTVDLELEKQLRDGYASLEEREHTKDRLIEQLAEFMDELNHCLVAY